VGSTRLALVSILTADDFFQGLGVVFVCAATHNCNRVGENTKIQQRPERSKMAECIYSLSLKLAWREDNAKTLSALLRGLSAANKITDTTKPEEREPFLALINSVIQQLSGLDYGSITLEYVRRWIDLQKSLEEARTKPTSSSKPMYRSKDPYRSSQPGEYRVLDLYLAGAAPLQAAGFFSVGAAKPHSRAKISLLFQELRALFPMLVWWRMSPQEEQAPLSLEEALRSDATLVAL
jgi:hypothetical protein